MPDVGKLSLLLALAITAYSVVAYFLGLRLNYKSLLSSARGGVLAVGFLTTVASLVLFYLLLVSDFSVQYVYSYTNRNLPVFYKISAFWAGNAGSLLLWGWLLAILAVIVANVKKGPLHNLVPYVLLILLVNELFFLLLLNFVANPFEKLNFTPDDGAGLNPLLQNPGMVIHPVTMYLGYVSFAVPFAWSMAALITRKINREWFVVLRRWSLIAWLFLTLGNLYGAQWAYVELGWGGYWAWDPVENASLMPWLTGTAFIHSIMIQERKGMLKTWNMALISITYLLTIFGTYLTRSGVLASVHAFGDNLLGNLFLGFLAFMFLLSLYLMVKNREMLQEEMELESYLSRESSFLVNNLLFAGITFAVFWGTMLPKISQVFRGVSMTVSPEFFNQVTAPLFLAMLALMGICPLFAWQKGSGQKLVQNLWLPFLLAVVGGALVYLLTGHRVLYALAGYVVAFFVALTTLREYLKGIGARRRNTGEGLVTAFWNLVSKNRRRWGGYLVHLGVVLMAVGIIGSNVYQVEVTKTVARGETIQVGDYALTYNGLQEKQEGDQTVVYAEMPVTYKGKDLGTVKPEKIFYTYWEQPSTEVALKSSLKEDLYVVLSGWEAGGEKATFKVDINPLVNLLWLGGYVLIFGTLFALWPGEGSHISPRYVQNLGSTKPSA